ncbi:MAG: TolC family protein [Acidiphilium sp.]|nr:TolC family protein [Acidiphilium sp.]MDD4934531.1 TolC family protein [Acidiphilium sp.]
MIGNNPKVRPVWGCIFLSGVLLLTGCARYQSRSIMPAQAARHLSARRLDDPELQRFLAAMGEPAGHRWGLRALTLVAVYERPDLVIANADYALAQGGLVSARALPNPELSISPTYNVTNGNPSPLKIGPIVSFLLSSLGARQAGIAAAQDQAAAARQAIVTAAWLVRARVRNALLALWSARQQRIWAGREQSLTVASAKAIDQRFHAGMVSSVTRAQADLAAEQAGFFAATARRDLEMARAQLAAAIGVPVVALNSIVVSTVAFDRLPTPGGFGDLTRIALTTRPSVQAALAHYAAAQQNLRAAVDSQFPGLSIGPGYHYDQGDSKYILALALPLPILNQNQGPIAVARARRHLMAARFAAAQLHVLNQTGVAIVDYRASARELAAAAQIAASASAQTRAAEAAYRAGATGRVRLLEAEQAMVVARQNELTAEIQLRAALGRLEDSLHHRFFGVLP